MAAFTGKYLEPEVMDPLKIFPTKINLINTTNQDQFVCSSEFDVENLETYSRAIQGPNAAKWAKAIEEKLGQLHKNET